MDRMDDLNSGDEDKGAIQKCIKDCRKITIIYQMIYYGYLTSAFLGAMVNGTTPYHMYNPYISPITDVYPIVYVVVLRTHIDLLKRRIENLRSDPDKSEDENYDELVKCVKAHRYADLIRPVISNTVFVQLVCTGLLLGLSTVSIMFFDIVDRLVTVYYSMAILSQTFPFCYTCESLLGDCNDLSVVILHSKWIGAEPRFRKTLVLFMHQTQAPVSFTACGVVQIGLDTNIKMVKFAFSVFTVVQGMDLMEKFKQ
ncbi:odorant receptor 85a-like [Drosophila bipectinata]|uniref:odorant receptor 85a-like n=1 Tax=Drosophila bipectinata TaxID=42026 RepID=UPI0038B3DD78